MTVLKYVLIEAKYVLRVFEHILTLAKYVLTLSKNVLTNVCREKGLLLSLFTYLVGWHAGAVSFLPSDIIWPS